MKGQERRRDEKRKPLKTLMEKRAAKWAKKEGKTTLIAPGSSIKEGKFKAARLTVGRLSPAKSRSGMMIQDLTSA
jgi:hypothetical protein